MTTEVLRAGRKAGRHNVKGVCVPGHTNSHTLHMCSEITLGLTLNT